MSIVKYTPVLNKGYVKLVDCMGSDLSVVNAARASFEKESLEFSAKDSKLIDFLARENHTSPFRHAFLTFEIKAPLMVARQMYKYIVGSDHTMDGWNEASRRYVTSEPTFYVPKEWRSAPENKKQGSGEPIPNYFQFKFIEKLIKHQEAGLELYNEALEQDICPEQARLFLASYGLYINWRWSCSLQSVMHFIKERTADEAQWEIRQYALAIQVMVSDCFPVSFNALMLNK